MNTSTTDTTPGAAAPVDEKPVETIPPEAHVATDDPFEGPVREPVSDAQASSGADANASEPTTQGPVASALGEDAARAYLPLLFGAMDALAGAGAVWLIRRKLGDDATTEIMLQARTLATLHDAEKMALEAALVRRLATIELTPDEALMFTVVAIYAAKALAVSSLEGPNRASEPLTLQVA